MLKILDYEINKVFLFKVKILMFIYLFISFKS